MVNTIDLIKEMKEYAEDNNVPIITDEGIDYIRNYIKENNIKRILEVGANVIVAGSAVFKGDAEENAKQMMEILKKYE